MCSTALAKEYLVRRQLHSETFRLHRQLQFPEVSWLGF